MASTKFDLFGYPKLELLGFLWTLEEDGDLICPLKTEVRNLILKATFLNIFLSSRAKWYIEDQNLKAALICMQSVLQNTYLDIRLLMIDISNIMSQEISCFCMPMNLDALLSSMLERFERLNPYIQQVYATLSESSRSITDLNDEATMENLDFLLENIEYVLNWNGGFDAPVKEELEALKKGLTFLRTFLAFSSRRCCKLLQLKDFLIHAESLADNISCLLYFCSINYKMNFQMAKGIKMKISSEVQKFRPAKADVREIYVKALRASKSAKVVEETDLGFLNSLRDYMLELLDTKLSFNKNQIVFLHEGVRFLTIFLTMDPSYREHYMYHDLERINDVIIEMGCVIFSLHNHNKKRELKIAVSSLQHIIKLLKEDPRKEYVKYNRQRWQPIFPRLDAAELIRQVLEEFQEMQNDESTSIGVLHHLIGVVQKEFVSLNEFFSQFTKELPSQPEELQIKGNRILTDIGVFLNFLLSSSFFENHKFGMFAFIEEIKMMKLTLKDLQKRMISSGKINEGKIGEQMTNRSNSSSIPEIEDQFRWLEMNVDLTCPLKDEVKTLRLKASFLNVFLNCKGKWHVEDGNLNVLLTRILIVFQNANQDLQRLWADFIDKGCCLPMNINYLLSRMLQKFELLDLDLQEVYTIFSKSSRFVANMSDEAVMGSLNSLLGNIDELLRCKAELVASVKEELEAVKNGVRFLRNFLGFTVKRCRNLGKLKAVLINAASLAGNISCLLYLCSVNVKMNDQMANKMKVQLLMELQKFSPEKPEVKEIYIKALQASRLAKQMKVDVFDLDFLESLRDYLVASDNKLSSMNHIKGLIISIQEELQFLINFLAIDLTLEERIENDQIFNDIFARISFVINEIGYVVCSNQDEEKNEEMARELHKEVSDLRTIIVVAKEDARKMYDLYVPKSLRSNFPRTDGLGFVCTLVRDLKKWLNIMADLGSPLEHHISFVEEELLSAVKDFLDITKQPNQCKELQSQWTRFIDTGYQTEYVIHSFLGGEGTVYCHKLGLFNVIEEIKEIKEELKAIKNKMAEDTKIRDLYCFPGQISMEANSTENSADLSSEEKQADAKSTMKLVIFEEEEEAIRMELINGTQKLLFLSIVGMPGIGKTTLADTVFQHSSINQHFHVKARCIVGLAHDKERLFLEILREINGQSYEYDDEDLDQKLYQSLKCRRYLIFMDDIWDIRAWEDIRASFPDDDNGSRIMFTSRLNDISSKAGSESINYCLSLLSIDKSWEMLQKKVFENGRCPQKLVKVGREIAVNCKGLPLTIDLIAGILRMTKKKNWNKVAGSMKMHLFDDPQGRCQKALELSYRNLPDQMKPCFLYFAAFPPDSNIPTGKLILLWISEGFIQLQEDDQRSLEVAAQDILDNLIDRNLVAVSNWKSLQRVKSSHVHDLLHDFASAKAQEEYFMLKIHCEANNSSLLADGYPWSEQYRLCIDSDKWEQFIGSKSYCPRARVLICCNHDIKPECRLSNFSNFKLLRVLDITGICSDGSPTIFTLIHLRFLAVRIMSGKILSQIHKLWNLESFIMIGHDLDGYLHLDKICNMVRLRHFHYRKYFSLRYCREKILEKCFLFDNLRSLYHLQVSYSEDIEKILKLMPNLLELKVKFCNPDGGCYPFPKLDFLVKLESLEVTHEHHPYPCKITNFPPHLKKLVLSKFNVPWTEISEIGNLEHLEILKLQDKAFLGPTWDMVDEQFPKLRYLSLSDLDIEEWNASEDHLSCLEKLRVKECAKLKELPSCLEQIATLQQISLTDCSSSAKNSAKKIKEEQVDAGNEQFDLSMYYLELTPECVFDQIMGIERHDGFV